MEYIFFTFTVLPKNIKVAYNKNPHGLTSIDTL